VHKTQGSQWGNVVIPDDWRGADRDLWLYTAVTRAINSVTVVRYRYS
jgi:ATP-dependent exoDNAse (exonuclease V) alpha subunit